MTRRAAALTAPTVHLNGSDGATLREGYRRAADAIRRAMEVHGEASPNGRDYYLQGPEAYYTAAREHGERAARLQAVMEELAALWEAVDEQCAQRG